MTTGPDYVRRDVLVRARDSYTTLLANWPAGDGAGREDVVAALLDAKEELKRLPST
jgi:hypothetical protein